MEPETDRVSASEYTWFITKGLASLFTKLDSGDIIEAAAVGREGIVGLSGITSKNGIPIWAQVHCGEGNFVCSITLLREGMEHEFKPAKVGAMIGKLNELTLTIECGHIQLVVRIRGLVDKRGLYELDYAARLAAYRMLEKDCSLTESSRKT